MKITLEHYDWKYTVETSRDDLSADEMITTFRGMLISAGYPISKYPEEQ